MSVDAVIILGHSDPVIARQRAVFGVRLARKRHIPWLILSGGFSFSLPQHPNDTETHVMRVKAEQLGWPGDRILEEEKSKDTIGNAYFVRTEILDPRHWLRVAVVTSDFHRRRAAFIFKKILGPEAQIDVFEAPASGPFKTRIYRRIVERKTFHVLKDWLKDVTDGDLPQIQALLFRDHPGYASNPSVSLKELRKRIKKAPFWQ